MEYLQFLRLETAICFTNETKMKQATGLTQTKSPGLRPGLLIKLLIKLLMILPEH